MDSRQHRTKDSPHYRSGFYARTFCWVGHPLFLIIGLCALQACVFYDPTNGPTRPGSECNLISGLQIVARQPAIDATDISPIASISVTLSAPSDAVSFDVSQGGIAIPGTTRTGVDERSYFFSPDVGFAAGPVDVVVRASDCQWSWSFSVTPGLPLATSLVGNIYRLDLALAHQIEPPILAELIHDAATIQPTILLEVTASSPEGDALSGIAAWESGRMVGLPGSQDLCLESLQVPLFDYVGPTFHLGPIDWVFFSYGTTFPMDALEVRGRITQDGSIISDTVVSGKVDLRPLEYAMQLSWDSACALVAQSGASPCISCQEDGVAACLPFSLAGIVAPSVRADPLDPNSGPTHLECID